MKNKLFKNKTFFIAALLFFAWANFAQADANEEIEQKIINYINQERVKAGLDQLEVSKLLSEAAEMKAEDMLGNDYFAHTSPAGIDPWHWFKEVGYNYKYAGENLGMDFTTAMSVHNAWMDSPTHRENILSPNYKEVGVAVLDGIIDKQETKVAVQSFGKKLGGEREDIRNVINGLNDTKKEELKKNKDDIIITESSIRYWEGEGSGEAIVFAEIEGNVKKVRVKIGSENFALEKLRDNVYMNLITLEGMDFEEEDVYVEVFNKEDDKKIAQIGESRFSESLASKEKIEKEEDLVGAAGVIKKDNFMNILRNWLNKSGLVVVVICLFVLTVANVWILEKEEERFLKNLNTKN
jgi:hypothetical protein